MEVSVEKQEEIARKITISIDADVFDKAVKSQLSRFARDAKIKGFRKGKVPQKCSNSNLVAAHSRKALMQ